MIDKPYEARLGSDGKPCVSGPGNGFGYDAGTLWPDMRLSTVPDAEAAAKIANEAYRVGYERARHDMRKALGLEPTNG
jgi:hypothetical protein